MHQPNIPNSLFFIWMGNSFPYANQLAVLSAMHHHPEATITLYQKGLSTDHPDLKSIISHSQFQMEEIKDDWFMNLPDEGLALKLFQELSSPASKANLLRLAILYKKGGVYLDTDTITIKSMEPLLSERGFIGKEHVALPREYFSSRNPLKYLGVAWRFPYREICARLPWGRSWFKPAEPFFHQSVNNAIVGSMPQHPLIRQALQTISTMSNIEQRKRFRLGTHLMQDVTQNSDSQEFRVFPPTYFYPLGPEISAHWFKVNSGKKWESYTSANTYVIHWYNSVEGRFLKGSLDADWVENNPTTAFSLLAKKYFTH